MSDTAIFKRLVLIGAGLIGSSIAHRVRADGLAEKIVITTRSQDTLKRIEELRLGDVYFLDAAQAVEGADCVDRKSVV